MKRLVFFVLALALCACASTDLQMIDSRTAMLSISAPPAVSDAAIVRSVLVRAATETQKRGFQKFAVLNAQDTESNATAYMPASTTTTGSYTGSVIGSGTYSQTTGGSVPININRRGVNIVFKMLVAGETSTGTIYDAAEILSAQD